jgi:hypothetical protein
MTRMQLILTLAAWRPDLTAYRQVEETYRISLRSLARRYLELHDEIANLDDMFGAIVKDPAPELMAQTAIGLNSAAQLLLTAGDNPDRLKSEASFAALCGVSLVPASSGATVRHRLNRGGDRAANSAIHIVAIGRLRLDAHTQDYVARASQRGTRSSRQSAASNAISPAKSSASSCGGTERSTKAKSRLDSLKGVQGSQFTSIDWAAFLRAHNLEHSMSRQGNCHDNALAESFSICSSGTRSDCEPIALAKKPDRTCSISSRCSITRSASMRGTGCCHQSSSNCGRR